MATHSSVLASRIPGTGEPGGMSSMGSLGVGHDSSDLGAMCFRSRRYTGELPLQEFLWKAGIATPR